MIEYSLLTYLYAVFLILSGVVLLWVSFQQGSKWFFGSFFVLGLAHVFLGAWFLLASMGLGIDLVSQPACAWLQNTTTVNGNVTTYAWYNTCANSPAPESFTTLFVVWTWLLWIEVFLIFVVGFVAGMQKWLRVL